MGGSSSSEETSESKMVDTSGNVNNNIIIQEAKDTHHQMLVAEKLLVATYLLVSAEGIKLLIFLFIQLKQTFKKKYSKTNSNAWVQIIPFFVAIVN